MSDSALYAHRLLLRAGLSLANVFAWVFIFEYFYVLSGDFARALAGSAILYALSQLIIIVATPISAAHLRRGTKHSLMWGVVFASSAFVVLGATLSEDFSVSTLWRIAGFAVFLGIYRALYWIPYQLTRADIQPRAHMRSFLEVFIALMPLFAGITLASIPFAPPKILFGAAALMLLSMVPALFIVDTRERFSWSYGYTFQQLWRRKNHGLVLQSLLDGVQGAALFLVWPLAIFLIVEWSYFALGFVFSLSLLFILLLRRFYAWLLGSLGLKDSTIVYVVVVVTSWVARLAAGTPFGVIVADVYSYTAQPERSTRVDPLSYEQAGDRGSFIDEYTALKEIALAAGRIMLCVVIFLLAFIFALPVVFTMALAIAAAAAGLSVVLAKRATHASY